MAGAFQNIYSTVQEIATTVAGSFSWAKVIYSAILLGLIGIAFTELARLWFDTRTYIGNFAFYESGVEKAADGKTFSLQVLSQHKMLLQLFAAEERRRKAAVDPNKAEPVTAGSLAVQENTWWPREISPVHNPSSLLSEIELSVQGINIRDILTKFRQWISAPKEISGTVQKTDAGVRAAMSWSQGPAGGELILVEAQPDISKAALHVACSIIWAEGQRRNPQLADVARNDFCGWTDAWTGFVSFRDKIRTVAGLTDADIEQLKKLREYTTRLISGSGVYPEVYRLRADLLDLIPPSKRINDDLAQAQEDRNRYALLTNPTISKYDLLAAARPAIAIRNSELVGSISETWRGSLIPFKHNISTAVRATGVGRFYKKSEKHNFPYSFTGFAVRPGLILTASFGIPGFASPDLKFPVVIGDDYDAEFSFEEEAPRLGGPLKNAMRITKIEHRGSSAPDDYLAILRIEGHDERSNPPIDIERNKDRLANLLGRYAFVVGYPAKDPRMPEEFLKILLEGGEGLKRVMPGRILNVEDSYKPGVRKIKGDISTSGGTAGGPLVDLETGRAIGIHTSGILASDEGGKFSFASVLADFLSDQRVRKLLQMTD